jgi:zinc transporter 1/2/3
MESNQGQQTSGERDLVKFKIQALFIVAFVTFIGGLVPMKRPSPSLLSLGNAFSGGVFLAAGFLHMLAESVEGFSEIKKDSTFPYAYFWCIIGILIPLFLEKIVLQQQHSHQHGVPDLLESDTLSSSISTSTSTISSNPSVITVTSNYSFTRKFLASILLVVTLSVHALIEGMFFH